MDNPVRARAEVDVVTRISQTITVEFDIEPDIDMRQTAADLAIVEAERRASSTIFESGDVSSIDVTRVLLVPVS